MAWGGRGAWAMAFRAPGGQHRLLGRTGPPAPMPLVWTPRISVEHVKCGGWRDLSLHPQMVIIISGNLSFLNWLTIVPSRACFDDATLGFLFPSGPGCLKDQVLRMQEEEARGARAPRTRGG